MALNELPIRILLLEDCSVVTEFIEGFVLTHMNADLTSVADGRVGLKTAMDGEFDVCMLNVDLPSIDGYTIAEALSCLKPHLPLIFLTCATKEMIAPWAARQQFKVAYLRKPFRVENLLGKIQQVLKGEGWLEVEGS